MKKFLIALIISMCLSEAALSEEMIWYNFSTGKGEARLNPPSQEEMQNFIPQTPAAQGLYRVYLAKEKNHLEAAKLVLETALGLNKK